MKVMAERRPVMSHLRGGLGKEVEGSTEDHAGSPNRQVPL